jgi:lipopolysaccharide biosynthesis glycosyltransferase
MTPLIEINGCRNLFVSNHINLTAYYKLFLGGILKNYKKVLCLDVDIIVREDVVNLFNVDLQGKTIGAVVDPYLAAGSDFPWHKYAKTINIADIEKYFNSGVMLIDVEAIRAKNYEQQFIDIAKESDRMFHDQDTLNIAMQKTKCADVLFLDPRWNYLLSNDYDKFVKFTHGKYRNSAKIIHYTDACNKPWYWDCDLSEYWWEYAQMTPFYEVIMLGRVEQETKRIFREMESCKPLNRLLNYLRYLRYRLFGKIFPVAKRRRHYREKVKKYENTPPVKYFKYLRYKVFGKIFPVAKRRRRYREKAKQCKECFRHFIGQARALAS